MSSTQFISPQLRAHLRGLQLQVGRAGGDGFGLHSSRNRGAGLEFAQYRGYEPGDELRRIDWKLYARSDRYFIREAERDSPLSVWILLDTSASMRQHDAAHADFSKLDAGKILAACVIELALRQGDRFGLLGLGAGASLFVPAAAGAGQRDRCLHELRRVQAHGQGPNEAALRPFWERIQPPALVVLVSDFFDDVSRDIALRLAAARRDVVSVQLLSAEERDFPFSGGHRFIDPESGAERRVDAAAVRQDFLQRFGAARAELAQRFTAAGIRHVEHFLDRPLHEPLQHLFSPGRSDAS